MIIIADAHVDDDRGNDADFFLMLNAFEKNDQDLIFLGDIFELWIALPRYEKDIHKNFLTWCKEQKKYRTIGFIEGNHEYFVADEKNDHFSWCSAKAMWQDNKGNLFCHGDQINRRDINYLRFRRLVKNKIAKTIARFLPFGPVISELFKNYLKKTNPEFRKHLPEDEIAAFANDRFKDGIHSIFAAHFHQRHHYRSVESRALYILPAWMKAEQVTFCEASSKEINSYHWQELEDILADGKTF